MILMIASLALIIALASCLGVLFLYQKQLHSKQQASKIFEELKELRIKLRDLRGQFAEAEDDMQRVGSRTDSYKPPEKAESPLHDENEVDEPDLAGSLWQDVIFLARQGVSADKISKDLNITRGEVDLILSLQKFDPKSEN
jgi:hypothetical protein